MNVTFAQPAWEDYVYWQSTDPKMVKKINQLLKNIAEIPYEGLGKPEPLKHHFSGWWSRRITEEHRLVYRVLPNAIEVAQCRYHYDS